MTNDWELTDADQIADRLARKVDALGRRGRSATVVLHDGGHLEPSADRGPSVSAAEQLIRRYIGVRRFVTADYMQWGPRPVAERAR
jgi:hypothetical protein